MAKWEGTDPIKWAAKMKDFPQEAIRLFAFEVFNRVVEKTPVDTGNARSNWLVSVGEPSDEYNPPAVTKHKITRGKNKGKTKTKTNIHQTLKRTMKAGHLGITFSGDDTIYIQNNTPYIRKLEFGGFTDKPETEKTIGGFSKQAPAGMAGKTLAQADRLFEKAVDIAKAKNE